MLNIVNERFSLQVDLTKSNLTLVEKDIIRLPLSGYLVAERSRLKNRGQEHKLHKYSLKELFLIKNK